ncbi:MAG: hypothetical protein A2103_01695 [Gammaproteobacteria bacterium GWF2_41_13]|nr:MAG: hypothetical protein A2103_01695 [Gammaproteobacteria bacterium GWF2_41_13]
MFLLKFSGNEKGAKASAIMYSIVETCRANKIKPEDYVLYLLKNLPYVDRHNPAGYQQHTPRAYKLRLQAQSVKTNA